ncbi:hypothetical protein ACOI1C_15865 [Bacillus sp. DJP31]|uniref:hypothetical protein n=1 Tax=Bacillus sp. DJP31 TaxID=3409789 RepID=UPI003BB7852D
MKVLVKNGQKVIILPYKEDNFAEIQRLNNLEEWTNLVTEARIQRKHGGIPM